MNKPFSALNRMFRFYYDGFRNLSPWGRRVWIILIIKVFIIFIIFKIFFFPDFLKKKYNNDRQRSEYVMNQLINSPADHD